MGGSHIFCGAGVDRERAGREWGVLAREKGKRVVTGEFPYVAGSGPALVMSARASLS